LKYKRILNKQSFLWLVYFIVFLFVITNDAIYSPDTRSYINALPYRHLGYVIFLKTFYFFFNSLFDISVLIFQATFSLFAVHIFLKKTSKTLKLNRSSKVVLFIILLFPFFKPLSVANNICPEGISYGLYLLFVAYGLDIIFNENKKKWIILIGFYFALTFTRGQFILTPFIFAFVYFFKNKNQFPIRHVILKSAILVCMPILLILTESTYHKLKDGIFMTTPFGFVSASGLAFYVSKSEDKNHIKNDNDRRIFEMCYNKLSQENLLLSSQNDLQYYTQYYNYFHNNVPPICNHTIHALGKDYYYQKETQYKESTNYAHAKSYYKIEKTCKNLTLTLIKANFNKWLQLYFANISHGFYSSYLAILMVLVFLFSLIKFLINTNNKWYILLFILSALALANAMLVAFASHSIIRYLFYNYALLFLIFIILIKLLKHGIKN